MMDVLDSPVKEVDPRLQFCAAIKSLSQKSPQDINNLVNALPEKHQKFLKESF
jgi:hypothetical protein